MIFVTKFRANDLNPSKGKQIEFNKGVIESFFGFSKSEEDAVFECCSLAAPTVKRSIKVHFTLSPSRGDYKVYQNADGSMDLKDYFLNVLHLTSANLTDYFAIKKNGAAKYTLYYVPNHQLASDFFMQLSSDSLIYMAKDEDEAHKKHVEGDPSKLASQMIYYGCPGTGKSYEVKMIAEGKDGKNIIWYDKPEEGKKVGEKLDVEPADEEKKELENNIYRTTFHPDYDYATFVGCYKPSKNDKNELDYKFVPQVFTKAYIAALRHKDDPIFLIIEEINRGNCAQIFGDLFQLLDRTNGVSDYEIKPDAELAKYLASEKVPSESLKLPKNLHIYATMNTSDQSLFPMDSAFKRRWAMEYLPIDYKHGKAMKFTITVDGKQYPWIGFLQMVNEMILGATDSEDKQMGEFFIKGSVTEKEFINKVMFYLWNDVCKDLYNPRRVQAQYFLRVKNLLDGEKNDYFTFAELFSERNGNSRLLKEFFLYLEEKYKENHKDIKLTEDKRIDWETILAETVPTPGTTEE